MPETDKRLIIAEALAAQHINRNWVFAPDNAVPADARAYAVYDGAQIKGAGTTPSHASQMVAECQMPIVFYLPKGKGDA